MLDWIADYTTKLSVRVDFHGLKDCDCCFVFSSTHNVPIAASGAFTISQEASTHEMVIPPSIEKVPPVTQAASSEAR